MRTIFSAILFSISLQAAAAGFPWDGPAFTGDPGEIVRNAAAAKAHKDASSVVLLDERRIELDKMGRRNLMIRSVFRFAGSKSAESEWSTVEHRYSPWYQSKPEIRARVITPSGAVHWLKPETMSEAPVRENGDSGVFSDDRIIQAPLPAVEDGAVAEYEIKIQEHRPFFDQGISARLQYPVLLPRQIRIRLDHPADLTVQTKLRDIPDSARTESSPQKGVRRIEVNWAPPVVPETEELDWEASTPRFSYATAASWNVVAAGYEAVVEGAIRNAAPSVEEIVSGIPKELPLLELAGRLTARLHEAVRYTGIEFGEMAIVPAVPSTVLDRKFGDCKDKAALLVAMFRAFGVPAKVALLESAVSLDDVDETMPGLSIFNHAIVYVPGSSLWIDATADTTRIGDIPPGDQGRMALIASRDTTQLVKTPVSGSSQNRRLVEVDVTMNPDGKGRITETITATGAYEAEARSNLSGIPAEDRKNLESLAKHTYLSEKVGEVNVPKRYDWSQPAPYRAQFTMEETGRAVTEGDQGAAGLFEHLVLDSLPWKLTLLKKPEKPSKKNTLLTYAHQSEYRYRVKPATGFKLRTLPKSETFTYGPLTYSRKFEEQPDGVIVASFRMDTGKRVYSPEETELIRAGLSAYSEGKPVLLQFLSDAAESAALGDIKAAITATKKSVAADPKAPAPRIRISNLLLQASAGDAARREAKTATELDAKSAKAHHALGWALQHDSFGRRFTGNWDREGALAAHRKAVELDQSGLVAQADLAILLEHNGAGERYGAGSGLKEAEAIYRKALEKGGENHEIRRSLAALLLNAKEYDRLEKEVPKLDASVQVTFEILLAALTQSTGKAVLTAQQYYPETSARAQALVEAARNLLALRDYPKFIELFRAASRMSSNPQLSSQAEVFANLKRVEDSFAEPTDPKYPVQKLMHLMFSPQSANNWAAAVDEVISTEWQKMSEDKSDASLQEFQRVTKPVLATFEKSGFSRAVAADLVAAGLRFETEGDPELGYRVTGAGPGSRPMSFFVEKNASTGRYHIIGGGPDVSVVGQRVLDLAQAGKLDAARKWLDWAVKGVEIADNGITAGRPVHALIWSGITPETRGKSAILAAGAAMLGPHSNSPRAIAVLRAAAAAKTTLALERNQLNVALAKSLKRAKAWKELLEVAYQLEATKMFAGEGFEFEIDALRALERWTELHKVASAKLKGDAQNITALKGLMQATAAMKGQEAKSLEHAEQLSETLFASDSDRASAAWITLRLGGGAGSKKILDRLAAQQQPDLKSDHYYVLGLMQLASKQNPPEDAVRSLTAGLDRDEFSTLDAQPWVLLGKILETMGLPEDAAESFAKARQRTRQTDAGKWALGLVSKQ